MEFESTLNWTDNEVLKEIHLDQTNKNNGSQLHPKDQRPVNCNLVVISDPNQRMVTPPVTTIQTVITEESSDKALHPHNNDSSQDELQRDGDSINAETLLKSSQPESQRHGERFKQHSGINVQAINGQHEFNTS